MTTLRIHPFPAWIRSSAEDRGDRSARDAGRIHWGPEDFDAATAALDKIVAECFGPGPAGYAKFAAAERLEAAGVLSTNMTRAEFDAAVDAEAAGQ